MFDGRFSEIFVFRGGSPATGDRTAPNEVKQEEVDEDEDHEAMGISSNIPSNVRSNIPSMDTPIARPARGNGSKGSSKYLGVSRDKRAIGGKCWKAQSYRSTNGVPRIFPFQMECPMERSVE